MFCVHILNFRPHLPVSALSCTFPSFVVPAFSKYSACIICITYLLCIILYAYTAYFILRLYYKIMSLYNNKYICIIIRCCCCLSLCCIWVHSVLTLLASGKYFFIQIKFLQLSRVVILSNDDLRFGLEYLTAKLSHEMTAAQLLTCL